MSRPASELYEFGPFRLDLERRVFTREHQVVPLAPKTFDLLVLLVQSPGRAFSKRELMNALWPDTFVEEANLSFQISALRKALGEDGARRVETVPKHGYRFSADVQATVAADKSMAEPATSVTDEPSPVVPKRSDTRKVWLAIATITAALLVVVAFLTMVREPRTGAVRTSSALAVPLTAYPGDERTPSLSPDGSRVAFSWNGPALDNYDIYVKLAGPGEPVRLTTNTARDDSPVWSPDGRFIAFIRFTAPDTADLIVIPGHGGAERTIATLVPMPIPPSFRPISNLSWTPDGRWLAFGGATSSDGPRGIWLIAVDGSERRRLTESAGGETDHSPVVSPDGRYLAFLRATTVGRVAIFLVPLASGPAPSGTPRELTYGDYGVWGLAWMPEGRELVFSTGGHLGQSRTARIGVADSSRPPGPESLAFGEQATGISIAGTGRLVYSAQVRDTALYELALSGSPGRPVALAAFNSTFDEHTPAYSPDGKRLAFASTRSGTEEIWIANRDGSHPLLVTSMGGAQCANPQWSPDGRTILFDSRRTGSADLYLLQPDNGKLRHLTDHPGYEGEARWSRDGRSIYFGSNRTARDEVWRMPAAGGEPTQITRQGGIAAVESRDGYLYYAKDAPSPPSIWRVPVDGGGAEEPVVDGLSYSINFAVGTRGLYFVALNDTAAGPSVDFFDFSTRRRSTLVRLDKRFWFGMTLSPDERSLVFPLVDSAGSNLMLVDRVR
jgi:Tol biopolymer transport system component/DNA-binding winged helix-turn-helix (wHTH) protein